MTCNPAPPKPMLDSMEPGTSFDGYTVVERIAAGGQGEVYRATEGNGRLEAIKVLHPGLLKDQEGLARFQREARLSRVVDSPQVVRCHGDGVWQGRPYLVSDFITGVSLAGLLVDQPVLAEGEALSVLLDVILGLAAIHGTGLLHRDLKPGNVLLDRRGRALVADLGLARGIAQETHVTATGMAVGTPRYMSPEQATGRRDLDGRSDLYAFGILAYRLLAGRVPFDGESPLLVMRRHTSEAPPPLDHLRPGLHPECYAIVHQLLEKRREKRPADALAVHDRLLAVASERPLRRPRAVGTHSVDVTASTAALTPTPPGQHAQDAPTLPLGTPPLSGTTPNAPTVPAPTGEDPAAKRDLPPSSAKTLAGDTWAPPSSTATQAANALCIEAGEGHRLFCFDRPSLTAGRNGLDRGNDLCLRLLPSLEHADANRRISGQHCCFSRTDDGFTVTDCGGSGGTYRNRAPCPSAQPVPLVDRDELVLAGVLRLRVQILVHPDGGRALLLRRHGNATSHAYLLLAGPCLLGQNAQGAPAWTPGPSTLAAGVLAPGRAGIEWQGPGESGPRALTAGATLAGLPIPWLARAICPEDMK